MFLMKTWVSFDENMGIIWVSFDEIFKISEKKVAQCRKKLKKKRIVSRIR